MHLFNHDLNRSDQERYRNHTLLKTNSLHKNNVEKQ